MNTVNSLLEGASPYKVLQNQSAKLAGKWGKSGLLEGIGMASKAAGISTAPKKEVISESTNMINRFQKLANIKINQ